MAAAAPLLSITVSPVGTALLAGGATLAADLVGSAYKLVVAHAANRWRLWFAAYVDGETGDAAEVEAMLQAQAQSPIVQELIVENARAIAEAVTDSVVPVLARVTREYRLNARRPDGFFRGMRRLLSEVSEDELAALRDLVSRVALIDPVGDDERWIGLDHRGRTIRIHRLARGGPSGSLSADVRGTLPWSPYLERIYHLVAINGFSTDAQAVFGVSAAYPLILEIGLARRVQRILG